jgi:hypothetical protein
MSVLLMTVMAIQRGIVRTEQTVTDKIAHGIEKPSLPDILP